MKKKVSAILAVVLALTLMSPAALAVEANIPVPGSDMGLMSDAASTGTSTYTDSQGETHTVYLYPAGTTISGVGNNQFNPNGELTREQAATILVRLADALGQPLPEGTASFADNSSIASWAIEAVGRAKAGGIMDGTGNNQFSPQGAYTREQSIMTAYRLFETMQ